MKNLRQEILQLKNQGLRQFEIAKKLGCSTGTVSYHCNEKTRQKVLERKRKHNKPKSIHPYLDKELTIKTTSVCWKHAEAVCAAKLIEKGYDLFTPFNTGGEIDFVGYKNNKFYRIQVKSVSPTNNDKIEISICRNSLNYKQKISKNYENIDFFLIFDGNNIYKINSDLTKNKSMTLRYKVPKNNQIDNIYMASDYIF